MGPEGHRQRVELVRLNYEGEGRGGQVKVKDEVGKIATSVLQTILQTDWMLQDGTKGPLSRYRTEPNGIRMDQT